MASITIRNLDDRVRDRLRTRAAENGRSMEAEVRAILTTAVDAPTVERLGTRIHLRFAHSGAPDLELPARSDPARAADLPR